MQLPENTYQRSTPDVSESTGSKGHGGNTGSIHFSQEVNKSEWIIAT